MPVLTDNQIASNAKWGGWSSQGEIAIAVAVALAESGGRSDAVSPPNRNGTVDYGLWQVNSVHGYDPKSLLVPTQNATAAHAVYRAQGWKAWSVYNSGKYLIYMTRGRAAAGWAIGVGDGPISGEGVDPGLSRLDVLQKQLSFFTDGRTYIRLAMFLAGLFLLIVGVFKTTGFRVPTVTGAALKMAGGK